MFLLLGEGVRATLQMDRRGRRRASVCQGVKGCQAQGRGVGVPVLNIIAMCESLEEDRLYSLLLVVPVLVRLLWAVAGNGVDEMFLATSGDEMPG